MFVLFYKNTIGYFYKTKVVEKNGELLFIGVGFLLLLFCILKKFVKNNEIKHNKLLIILSVLFFDYNLIKGKFYSFIVGFDIYISVSNAINIVETGEWINKDIYYFESYPNTVFLVLFLTIIGEVSYIFLGYFSPMLVITIISFCTVLAGVLLYLVIYMLFSDVKLSWIGYTLYIIIVIFSPWQAVIYSDSLGVIVPILIIYMLVKEKKRENYLMVLGFLMIIGYSLKSHTIIVGIGIFIYELIVLIGKKRLSYIKIIKLLFGAILSVVIINALSYDVKKQLNLEKRVGYLHYMKLGLNIESMGLYSDKVYSDGIKQDSNLNRDSFNNKIIKDRINMMSKMDFNNHFTHKTPY